MAETHAGSPAPVSRRPAGSWRAKRSDDRTGIRRARRIIASLAVLALLTLLAFALLDPFRRPKTALVLAYPVSSDVAALPAAPAFAERDLESVAAATRPLLVGAPIDLTTNRPPSEIFGPRLRAAYPDCDVLLLLVRADAVAENGRAVLLWGYDTGQTEQRSYPVRDLLANLAGHPAALKLLLLDVAAPAPDRTSGRLVSDFSGALTEECKQGSDGVWVFVSHSSDERPHESPALAQSVFGYWLARGLAGAADRDGDGFLQLKELHGFVATGVAEWVDRTTGGRERQTPQLLHCGGRPASDEQLLLPAPRTLRRRDEDATLVAAFAQVAEEKGKSAADTAASSLKAKIPSDITNISTNVSAAANASSSAVGRAGENPGPSKAGDTKDGAKTASDGQPAGTKAAAESTSSKEGTEAETTTSASELLRTGWELRDDLEQETTVRPDPRRDAPHLWRAYCDRLVDLEQAALFGSEADRSDATRELRRLVPPLAEWAGGAAADPDAAEPVRSLIAARPEGTTLPPISFGFEEARATDGIPLPENVAALLTRYDTLVSSGTREEFEKWLAEAPPPSASYAEMALGKRLLAAGGLDWPTMRKTLSVRRIAERVAATAEATEWLAPSIEEADVLRRAGERLFLDGVGTNRSEIAEELLTEAERRYATVKADAATIRDAIHLKNRLYQQAPDLVRWYRRSEGLSGPRSPSLADTAALLEATEQLALRLASPTPGEVATVRAIAERTQALSTKVTAGLSPDYLRDVLITPPDPADDFLKIQSLLATTLPRAADRLALRDAGRRAERSLVESSPIAPAFRHPPRSRPSFGSDQFLGIAELEYRLAAMAVCEATSPSFQTLTEAYDSIRKESRGATLANPSRTQRFETALEEFWRQSRSAVAPSSDESAGTSNPSERLAALRGTERALRLLDGRDALRIRRFPLADLRTEILASVLSRQATRIELDRANAPEEERRALAEAAASCRQAAAQLTGREIATVRPDGIAVEGTNQVSLESEAAASAELTIRNLSDEPADIWLVLDHDPDLVEVERLSETLSPSYRLRRQSGAAMSSVVDPVLLNRPDRRSDEPPAFRLPGGGSRSVTLGLRRRSGAGGPTRVIVRAIARRIGATEANGADASIVRKDLVVQLPTIAPAVLIVEGPPGTVIEEPGRQVLAPFPNRSTIFRFLLTRSSENAASVDLALFAVEPDQSLADDVSLGDQLPDGVAIDPAAAASLLDRWTNGIPLFSATEFSVPGNETPVALPFPKPAGAEGASRPAIEKGLLVVLTDRANGRRSFHLVTVRPQHPRRYLEPAVRYDADAQRIEIAVRARDKALLPPGGSRITAEIVETLPPESARRLKGVVDAATDAAKLYADVAGLDGSVTLRLTADDYPRAFLYRIPLAGSRSNVPVETGEAAVRIIAPSNGASYKSPLAGVPTAIEVDAPLGARWDGGDAVEIGLDLDRDRELRGERSIRLESDRQVAVEIQELAPTGAVAVNARVTDFRLELPADHVPRGRVNVIGRLAAGGREAWSAPVEIAIDDVPPNVGRVMLGARRVVRGAPLRIVAEASDDDLSGVARVLVGVDVDRTGEFSEKVPPVAAVNEQGRWIAAVDTAPLAPGPYFALVQVTDAVGIAGAYSRVRFEVVTPEQMAADRAAAVNKVAGFVNYRGRVMAGFDVSIEPLAPPAPSDAKQPATAAPSAPIPKVKTDERGAFEFPRVPPGKYRVSAEGLYANRIRVGTAEVDVPPFPVEVPPVEVAVDPR